MVYCRDMISDLTIHCFSANILFGIAAVLYGLKSKGMPGAFYTLLALSGAILWTLLGTHTASFFSAAENWCRFGAFLLWNLLTFLPWGILCHSKYKTSEPQDFYHGIAGILTQLSFFSGIVFLTVGNDLQTVLEYDICRYCAGLLLLEVPAFCLTAFAFSLKKESWRCPDATLAIAAWCCALFLFCTGLFFLKVSV